jgi:preprotein translocase subunit SecA
MTNLNSLITGLIQVISKRVTAFGISLVEERLSQIRDYSDDQIKSELQKHFNGEVSTVINENKSIKDKIISRLNKVIFKTNLDAITAEIIALGAEAFRRAPADLPAGSVLFKQQLQAAVAITQQCLVQMNTGEGKTYAILPGALSLLARHGKVYVICANDYLAERDAKRTKSYWNFLGISVGLGLYNLTDPSNWNAQIIYTTLDSIIFQHLSTQLVPFTPENRIDFSCCIIDEADSVLLDQSGKDFNLTEEFSTRHFDWQFAFRILELINSKNDIEIDPFDHSCTLTESGVNRIKEIIYEEKIKIDQLGAIRRSIEIAFTAKHIVKEDIDYIIENNRIHPFDKISGRVAYDQYRDWIIPLEVLLGFSPRAEKQDLIGANSSLFIKKFKHKSGLSGTLVMDMIEYFTIFMLPVIIIKPRLIRHRTKIANFVFPVKEGATDSLYKAIIKAAVDQRRPVLVGCENIYEVQEIYKKLIDEPGIKELNIFAITGKDDVNVAEIFDKGGNVGTVIIATKLGGRGVDIRLSDEAIQNGGLALFSLGHARELRHDAQLLGRAGRQGQPFTAAFYLSLEDKLLVDFNLKLVKSMVKAFGTSPNENINSPMFTSSILRAQKQIRKYNLGMKYTANNLEAFRFQVQEEQARIINLFQSPANSGKNKEFLSYSFINEIIETFIGLRVQPLLSKNNNASQCKILLSEIEELSGLKLPDQFINEIEDREPEIVVKKIQAELIRITDAIISKATERSKLYDSAFTQVTKIKRETYESVEKLNKAIRKEERRLDAFNESGNEPEIPADVDIESAAEFPEIGESELIRDYADRLIAITSNENNPSNLTVFIGNIKKLIPVIEQHKLDTILDILEKNNAIESYLLNNKRPPRLVTKLAILKCWRHYREECERNISIMYKKQNKAIDRNRNLLESETVLWEKYRGLLCTEILKNISYLESPEKLESLFWTYENVAEVTSQSREQREIKWEVKNKPLIITRNEARNEYIDEFIRSYGDKLSKRNEVNKVRFVLTNFIKQNPLSDLKTANQSLIALDKWKKTEMEEFGAALERRKFNAKWIRYFMLFLRQKGIVGSIPDIRQRATAYMNSVFGNFSNVKFTLSFAQIIFSFLLFIFIVSLKNSHTQINISEFGMYCDRLFLCGFLYKGLINGPIMCGFLISTLILKNKAAPIAKFLSVSIAVLLSVILFWNGSTMITIGSSLLIILFVVALSVFFYNIIMMSEIVFGLNLLGLWLFISLWNYVQDNFQMKSMESALIGSLCVLYFIFSRMVNKVELVFMSTWFKSSVISMDTENIRVGCNIEGTSIPSYFYALVGTLVANILIGHSEFITSLDMKYSINVLYLLDILIFLLILIYSNMKTIQSRTRESAWRRKLSNSRQILVDGNVLEQAVELPLGESLRKARNRLFGQSVLFHTLSLSIVATLLYEQSRTGELIPAALIVYTISILLIYYAVSFLIELRSLFMGAVSSDFDSVDFSDLHEPEAGEGGFFHKLKEMLEPKGWFMPIIHLIIILLLLYEVIHMVLKNFFH